MQYLFWKPCAGTQYRDIGDLSTIQRTVAKAQSITKYIYKLQPPVNALMQNITAGECFATKNLFTLKPIQR